MDKQQLLVVKIGGNVINDDGELHQFLTDFAALSQPRILVHGGGKLATELANKLEIPVQMVDGRRITDAEMLKIVTMVYGGLINKNSVAQLQKLGCNAIGLTGADANIMLAKKRSGWDRDYGFVGDIERIDSQMLATLLNSGLTPVLAPLTHDGNGNLLNTNADTIAAAIAQSMTADYHVSLMYCFEKKGVLENPADPESVISSINPLTYNDLKTKGIISAGMIPKLDNAFSAIAAGVEKVHICHAKDFRKIAGGESAGTLLLP